MEGKILSLHFSLDEFTSSDTALRLGIRNVPPAKVLDNLYRTAILLERVREFLSLRFGGDVPIRITSGYRSLQLNRAIGSKDSSDHITGRAADFVAPRYGTPGTIAQTLAANYDNLDIGQVILEFNGWVHISTKRPEKSANRILTINNDGVHPGIVL